MDIRIGTTIITKATAITTVTIEITKITAIITATTMAIKDSQEEITNRIVTE